MVGRVYREAPLPARRPVDTRIHEDRIESLGCGHLSFTGIGSLKSSNEGQRMVAVKESMARETGEGGGWVFFKE